MLKSTEKHYQIYRGFSFFLQRKKKTKLERCVLPSKIKAVGDNVTVCKYPAC